MGKSCPRTACFLTFEYENDMRKPNWCKLAFSVRVSKLLYVLRQYMSEFSDSLMMSFNPYE